MENCIIENFFQSLFNSKTLTTVYTEGIPREMMASNVNEEGWFNWKPIDGTLNSKVYAELEDKFGISFPDIFIEWHKRYFFLDGDCSLLRLPFSNPHEPLGEIINLIDNDSAHSLAKINIYPFAMEGNDSGFLVFDGREEKKNNDFPIRVFDYINSEELDGLSTIIFSSFAKLLECLTYYINELKTRNDFEIVQEFKEIDPLGAGKYGENYWLNWSKMLKANYDYNKENPWPF